MDVSLHDNRHVRCYNLIDDQTQPKGATRYNKCRTSHATRSWILNFTSAANCRTTKTTASAGGHWFTGFCNSQVPEPKIWIADSCGNWKIPCPGSRRCSCVAFIPGPRTSPKFFGVHLWPPSSASIIFHRKHPSQSKITYSKLNPAKWSFCRATYGNLVTTSFSLKWWRKASVGFLYFSKKKI